MNKRMVLFAALACAPVAGLSGMARQLCRVVRAAPAALVTAGLAHQAPSYCHSQEPQKPWWFVEWRESADRVLRDVDSLQSDSSKYYNLFAGFLSRSDFDPNAMVNYPSEQPLVIALLRLKRLSGAHFSEIYEKAVRHPNFDISRVRLWLEAHPNKAEILDQIRRNARHPSDSGDRGESLEIVNGILALLGVLSWEEAEPFFRRLLLFEDESGVRIFLENNRLHKAGRWFYYAKKQYAIALAQNADKEFWRLEQPFYSEERLENKRKIMELLRIEWEKDIKEQAKAYALWCGWYETPAFIDPTDSDAPME